MVLLKSGVLGDWVFFFSLSFAWLPKTLDQTPPVPFFQNSFTFYITQI